MRRWAFSTFAGLSLVLGLATVGVWAATARTFNPLSGPRLTVWNSAKGWYRIGLLKQGLSLERYRRLPQPTTTRPSGDQVGAYDAWNRQYARRSEQRRLGFGSGLMPAARPGSTPAHMAVTGTIYWWCFPYWPLVLGSTILPGLWLRRSMRQRRRRHLGLCPLCGYDLRASPQRCPECGTPVPTR